MEVTFTDRLLDFSETKLDLRDATSLPSTVYTSGEIFEIELERIFYKRWLAICHESRFSNAGDILVKNIGKKSILIVRGDDGKLRAFYNVCRHRGARLAPESGNTRVIQCPYHAWTYKLDGTLGGCPDMETYFEGTAFEKKDYPLYPVKLELWGGFVWINLDPKNEQSLRSYLGDFTDRFDRYDTAKLRWVATQGIYDVDCNWKSMLENFNECYHCPAVHPETLKKYYRDFKPADHSKIAGPYVMLQWKDCPWEGAPLKSEESHLKLTEEDLRMQWLPLVFPNFQFTFTPNWVMTLAAWPQGPTKLKLEIEIYAYDWSAHDDYSEMVRIQDLVTRQDIEICKIQSAGLESGVFEGCKFNAMEESIYSFQKLYAEAMDEI